MRKRKILLGFLFSSIFCLVNGQEIDLNRITLAGFTQGTYYKIIYYASDSVVTQKEIDLFLDDFLQTASLWNANSIISKVNRNEEVELNESFITIFETAQQISALTDGAYDITVGNLVNTWGFGIGKENISKKTIDSLLQYVGYEKISIVNNKIVKQSPSITIDFNGIAKGYTVDLVLRWFSERGINSSFVDIGGEIGTSGLPADGSPWLIGIEKPADYASSDREIRNVIALTGKSVATSGTYRKYIERDGLRYSHTIDPKTGYPVSHHLLSVSVIADQCYIADALATAFMVMGMEKAMRFLYQNPQYDAYFIIYDKEEGYKDFCSKGFQKYIYTN